MEVFHPGDFLIIQVTDATLEYDLEERVRKAFDEAFPAVSTMFISTPSTTTSKIEILAVYRCNGATEGQRIRGQLRLPMTG